MTKSSDLLTDSPFEQMEAVLRELKNAKKAALKEKKIDLTQDQWDVIKCISELENPNQSAIAAATHKDPAAITRMIDLLVKKELVQRKEEKSDKRAYLVKLTRKGAGLVRRIGPLEEKIFASALAEVSDRDLKTIRRIAGKIIDGVAE